MSDTQLIGYRYQSNLTVFKSAVDVAKELIESKDLYILFGSSGLMVKSMQFFDNVTFSEKYSAISYNDFIEILDEEILNLLEAMLQDSHSSGVMQWLKDNTANEDEAKRYFSDFQHKVSYVREHILREESEHLYKFKLSPTIKKIFAVGHNICKHVSKTHGEIVFAQIEVSTSKRLVPSSAPHSERINIYDNADKLNFACDSNDLECLIKMLSTIKKELDGVESNE